MPWTDETKVEIYGMFESRSMWHKTNTPFYKKNIIPSHLVVVGQICRGGGSRKRGKYFFHSLVAFNLFSRFVEETRYMLRNRLFNRSCLAAASDSRNGSVSTEPVCLSVVLATNKMSNAHCKGSHEIWNWLSPEDIPHIFPIPSFTIKLTSVVLSKLSHQLRKGRHLRHNLMPLLELPKFSTFMTFCHMSSTGQNLLCSWLQTKLMSPLHPWLYLTLSAK